MIDAPAGPRAAFAGTQPLPADYVKFVRQAEDLLSPLVDLMKPGAADLPIEGQLSNHGLQADRLESFARPCLWAAHWLVAEPLADSLLSRDAVADWFRRGLLVGTDPVHPSYWGPSANHHQHTVEMGALVLAFEMAGTWLWDPFTSRERAQIAAWLATVRGVGLHRNNHLFFGVIPLCFLVKHGYGIASDRPCITRWLDLLETMAIGGGWFIDGMNESIDHYNAYAFHYYGLWWGRLFGEMDPTRADRWREWTRSFLADYVHFFAASGEPVPFGRSMTYRFAASAPFALAELCGASPLPPGQSRRLCTRNLDFFLQHDVLQSQGALSLGWLDEFPAITEAYSCAGSTYWAAKGLAPLLLPPTSEFWTAPSEKLPAEAADFSHPIPQTGMVLRSTNGEVELLTAATSISGVNTAFGAFKWGKLSYRTGVGLEVKPKDGPYPLDASLTAESRDHAFFGRHPTHPLEIEADHLSSVYALGDRFSQFNVQLESHLWWRKGWQLHLHRYHAHQPSSLILGAYSLAASDASLLSEKSEGLFILADNTRHGTALQSLHGFLETSTRRSAELRTHISAPHSLTLLLQTDWLQGEGCLAALTWVGPSSEKPIPWTAEKSAPDRLTLVHPTDGAWNIRHEALSSLTL